MSEAQRKLPLLNCYAEPGQRGVIWTRWKEALETFLDAEDVHCQRRMKSMLLYHGGMDLQDIFRGLPRTNVMYLDEEAHQFDIAIQQLDRHFLSEANTSLERGKLERMYQKEDEGINQFVVRLRNQARFCGFPDDFVEEAIKDRVIQHCFGKNLRDKLMELDRPSLDQVVRRAIMFEENALKSREMENFLKPSTPMYSTDVHQINARKRSDFGYKDKENGPRNFQNATKRECFRCGNWNHLAFSENCPAKNRKCNGCGKVGHYQSKCRMAQGSQKRDVSRDGNPSYQAKKPRYDSVNQVDDVYCLSINMTKEEYSVVVGGVRIQMIIDSGCSSNMIALQLWEKMKVLKAQVDNWSLDSDKMFKAYANKQPLKVVGCFEAVISAGLNQVRAKFYVIEGASQSLLGRETAMNLRMLKIGFDLDFEEVQSVDEPNVLKPFPKMKGISAQIHIDDSIKPVQQSYRRVPCPLEKKV